MRVLDFDDSYTSVGAPAVAGQWNAPDGNVSAPGWSWNSDSNTGVRRVGSDNMAVVCGGADISYWDTLGLHIGNNGALIGREKLTILQSVASGNAASNNYGSWTRYSNLTNTAFSADQIAASFDWRRTITADTTDTSSYPNTIFSYQVFDVASTKTYTHAAEVANVMLGAVTNAGAGSLAIARYAALSIEASTANTGTRKYGIKIGAQSGATYNALVSDSVAFAANYGLYLATTNANFLGGPLGIDGGTNTDTMLRVKGNAVLSATSQYGIYCDTKFSQNATVLATTITAQPVLDAQSFTCALLIGVGVATPTIGAGSAATRIANFYAGARTEGTNNAWAADNSSFSGNWTFNLTGTAPSLFTGPICHGSQDVASTASLTGMACAAVYTRLTGSTATTLHGITAGKSGQILILRNLTGQNLTIKDQSGTESTAANRIITSTGADITTTTDSVHWFIYDGTTARWILVAGQA